MEWLSELIGFLIVLFVFLLPLFRKFLIDKKQKKSPEEEGIEEFEEEEQVIEEELPPLPPTLKTHRLLKPGYDFSTELEEHELESSLRKKRFEKRYEPHFKESVVSQEFRLTERKKKQREKNPVVLAVKNKDPLQAMVILSEIFGRPKSL